MSPCDRSSPCDPCDDSCPTTYCCDDQRTSLTTNFSGIYEEDGTYAGSPAYKRLDSTAWLWRNWAEFPTTGWWVFSVTKGVTNQTPPYTADSVTQNEVTPNTCPTSDQYMWKNSEGYGGFAPGNVTAGACSNLCVTGAVNGAGSWQTAGCTNGTYVYGGLYGDYPFYQKVIPDSDPTCYPTGYYLVYWNETQGKWYLSTTGSEGTAYAGSSTTYPWDASWTTISVSEGTC